MPTITHDVIRANSRGVTTLLVVAYMGIFLLILNTLTSYVFEQATYGRALLAREQAVHVAEAGLEYYSWFLAHNTSALLNGTGIVSPYTYVVEDPEGGTVGSAVVTAVPYLQCGIVQWVDISSRGTADTNPGFPRTLSARYMHPSINMYSAVYDSNVWYGTSDAAIGPVHSNAGIRMDGSNTADVTSQVATWDCNSFFGCSPTRTGVPGVFGSGAGSSLWRYPVSPVSFSGMLPSYATLQGYAQAYGIAFSGTAVKVGGVTKATFSDVSGSDQKGIHLVFNANGTVSAYRVTGVKSVSSVHPDTPSVWSTDYDTISSESLIGTYAVPSSCGLIVVQAKTWIEGTVSGKVTLIAADTGSFSPDIVIHGNITYATASGTTGFTAVAERNVIIPIDSPDTLTVRGSIVSENGYFGRNYFVWGGAHSVPSEYRSYVIRSRLITIGTTVSKAQAVTTWVDGTNAVVSGYSTTASAYDRVLAFQPPAFTPVASTDYTFSLWRE